MGQQNTVNLQERLNSVSKGNCIDSNDKLCLISKVITLLGGGITKVEIPESEWCNLISIAIEEFVMEIQKWLTVNEWSSLYGKDITSTDICFALTQRSIDYELSFSYAYSKQVGLQSRGNYELKKDFVQIQSGTQVYEIPKGREINEVLWLTPSDIDHATFASLGYGDVVAGGANNFAGAGSGGVSGGYNNFNGAHYIAPAYDIFLRASDYGLKNRILQSDLVYKVTAGANGTKLLHLLSTPNNGNTIGIRKNLYGCKVWYHYYDTIANGGECLNDCKDIIKYPSDVPLPETDYCDMNTGSKIWIRKFLTAYAKETLGKARGKWSGEIAVPEAKLTLDYEMFLSEAKEELSDLRADLRKWLEELSSTKQLEKKASEAKNLNEILSYVPDGLFYI